MDFSSSRLSTKKPGDSCPKPKFEKACGNSEIKASRELFGEALASPKNGDVFISSPLPVNPSAGCSSAEPASVLLDG
jgi:hypothetical protein